jgi:hypothetical protein
VNAALSVTDTRRGKKMERSALYLSILDGCCASLPSKPTLRYPHSIVVRSFSLRALRRELVLLRTSSTKLRTSGSECCGWLHCGYDCGGHRSVHVFASRSSTYTHWAPKSNHVRIDTLMRGDVCSDIGDCRTKGSFCPGIPYA